MEGSSTKSIVLSYATFHVPVLLRSSRPEFVRLHDYGDMVHTRTRNYGQAAKSEVCARQETQIERRQRWANLLQQQHYYPVILEVLSEELPKHQTSTLIDTKDRISHIRECALILASAPLVLAAAVDGNLITHLLIKADLQKEYTLILDQAHHQPSIYLHFLADSYGAAPTPNQYMTIRSMIQDYLAEGSTSQHAHHLDNITPPTVSQSQSSLGHRKYLQTCHRSSARIDTLRRFCAGIQRRWTETPPYLRDTPMAFPPGECGYSKTSHIRMAQHRAHQSSNYVMNLVEDICTYLHRTKQFVQHFIMHQFIICLIFRPQQAAIAEIFCSGLLQVWVDDGGGFNAYPAGRSVATAGRVSAEEWEGYGRWVRRHSGLEGNLRVQREKSDEWRRALDGESGVDVEMLEGLDSGVDDGQEDGGDY
ncbi:hypothetical protein BDU57DRAFT_521762 [Ampelomyces quisqualis]|uniref:Uncharacterized protein n=1 Tax=Ampelomyces quisqualis TaxID=50730 RepID=A0A6A5QEY6_AMPQU|nr:hypothetical protein BDU57DRAFT_521762 [Ampelomyces quisqualis]